MNEITSIELMTIKNRTDLSMNSNEIAELTGKKHFHVMRDIRNQLMTLEEDPSKYLSSYKTSQNREMPCFNLNLVHTITLLTGYSFKLRVALIDRLGELEREAEHPKTTAASLRSYIDQLEKAIALQLENKEENL